MRIYRIPSRDHLLVYVQYQWQCPDLILFPYSLQFPCSASFLLFFLCIFSVCPLRAIYRHYHHHPHKVGTYEQQCILIYERRPTFFPAPLPLKPSVLQHSQVLYVRNRADIYVQIRQLNLLGQCYTINRNYALFIAAI